MPLTAKIQSREELAVEMRKQVKADQKKYRSGGDGTSDQGKNEIDAAKLLKGYEVSKEYVKNLGEERFLYENLIIALHVLTIIAMSGSGKTTFMYFVVAPELAKKGLTVWYIDADSPASDHKKMKAHADEHGFKFLNPDVNKGTSVNGLIDDLKKIATAHQDLTDHVFIFDTLKKFADLMSKGSVKDFYKLARKLANLGATVVLLGHANKYRDKDGNLVFEGVGDIRSDSDELIQFESKKNSLDGIDVTTVVDTDKGAKVRGLFKPFSFNISSSREIAFYSKPLDLTDRTMTATPKATDEEILAAAKEYLQIREEPVLQGKLADSVADLTAVGLKRVKRLLVQNAGPKELPKGEGKRFVYTIGERNAHLYELSKNDPVQTELSV